MPSSSLIFHPSSFTPHPSPGFLGFTKLEWQFLGAILGAELFLLALALCATLCLACAQ